MTFEFPEDVVDTAAQLRGFEPQAPKQMKHVMIAAASELDLLKAVAREAIETLDEAVCLRVGAMDSDSRAQDVSRQVQMAMKGVADRLRPLV